MIVSGTFEGVEQAIKWWAENNSPEWDVDFKDNEFGHEVKIFEVMPNQFVSFEIEPCGWDEYEDIERLGPFRDSMTPAVLVLRGWDFVMDTLVATFMWEDGRNEKALGQ